MAIQTIKLCGNLTEITFLVSSLGNEGPQMTRGFGPDRMSRKVTSSAKKYFAKRSLAYQRGLKRRLTFAAVAWSSKWAFGWRIVVVAQIVSSGVGGGFGGNRVNHPAELPEVV